MRKIVPAHPPTAQWRSNIPQTHPLYVVRRPGPKFPAPWFLKREYRQHRSLDPEGLPPTFAEWLQTASARAAQLARLTKGHIVPVVIHPGELEAWVRQTGRVVDDGARSAFAEALWLTMKYEITR
jgi:hypothetical protein